MIAPGANGSDPELDGALAGDPGLRVAARVAAIVRSSKLSSARAGSRGDSNGQEGQDWLKIDADS